MKTRINYKKINYKKLAQEFKQQKERFIGYQQESLYPKAYDDIIAQYDIMIEKYSEWAEKQDEIKLNLYTHNKQHIGYVILKENGEVEYVFFKEQMKQNG